MVGLNFMGYGRARDVSSDESLSSQLAPFLLNISWNFETKILQLAMTYLSTTYNEIMNKNTLKSMVTIQHCY